jgi:hypothetical protein
MGGGGGKRHASRTKRTYNPFDSHDAYSTLTAVWDTPEGSASFLQ